jgi:hypothetical protein
VIFKWWKQRSVSDDTFIYCRSRSEVYEALRWKLLRLNLAMATLDRDYHNGIANREGRILGVVDQEFSRSLPFLPVEMVFSPPSRSIYHDIEMGAVHGGSRVMVQRYGIGEDFFYRMTVQVTDENLSIFESIEKYMLSSSMSRHRFFHIVLSFDDGNSLGDSSSKKHIIDEQVADFRNWVECPEKPEYFYFNTPYNRLSFLGRVELRSPPWGTQWDEGEGAFHKAIFHSNDVAKFRSPGRAKRLSDAGPQNADESY